MQRLVGHNGNTFLSPLPCGPNLLQGTHGISSGKTSARMLMESVLALEVGAAASRIFSSAIWGRRNTSVRSESLWTGKILRKQEERQRETGQCKAWSGYLGTCKAQGDPTDTGHSPCTGADWEASLDRGFLLALARLPLLPSTQ